MALAYRYSLPRFLERGVGVTVSADIHDTEAAAGSTQQTATVGTFDLYDGSAAVVQATVTTLGPPVTYDLLAAEIPDTLPVSQRWQERWTLTIGGEVQTFKRRVYLCRFVPRQVITDVDLIDYHSDLAALRDSDQTSYTTQRTRAFAWVERMLIGAGNRPELVLDDSELAPMHIFKSLAIIFADFSISTGRSPDQRYMQMAEKYDKRAQEEFDSLVLIYDGDEDGLQGTDERKSAVPVILTNRPPRWR